MDDDGGDAEDQAAGRDMDSEGLFHGVSDAPWPLLDTGLEEGVLQTDKEFVCIMSCPVSSGDAEFKGG